MAKKVPPHLVASAKKCIFCGKPGLSKTHIWPDWLNKMLPGTTFNHVIQMGSGMKGTMKQGNIFSVKPYIRYYVAVTPNDILR